MGSHELIANASPAPLERSEIRLNDLHLLFQPGPFIVIWAAINQGVRAVEMGGAGDLKTLDIVVPVHGAIIVKMGLGVTGFGVGGNRAQIAVFARPTSIPVAKIKTQSNLSGELLEESVDGGWRGERVEPVFRHQTDALSLSHRGQALQSLCAQIQRLRGRPGFSSNDTRSLCSQLPGNLNPLFDPRHIPFGSGGMGDIAIIN